MNSKLYISANLCWLASKNVERVDDSTVSAIFNWDYAEITLFAVYFVKNSGDCGYGNEVVRFAEM